MDRQPWTVPDFALGARQRVGEQNPGAECPTTTARLAADMGIVRCCWKRWWMPPDFEEPATEPPTGSISGRPPDAVAWTESTKTTAEPSKTSSSIHWFVMPGNGYALIRPGNQIPLNVCWPTRLLLSRRLKVPLSGITMAMIKSQAVLEARVPGTGKDGGPSCATVKPFGGWKLLRD